MRTIRLLAFALVASLFMMPGAPLAAEGGRASVHAIVVIASSQKGASDRRLAPYEANLRRTLGRESFRFVGEGSAVVTSAGAARLSLPGGQDLELTLQGGRVNVRSGRTNVSVSIGETVVLAGHSAGGNGDVYATIVQTN